VPSPSSPRVRARIVDPAGGVVVEVDEVDVVDGVGVEVTTLGRVVGVGVEVIGFIL